MGKKIRFKLLKGSLLEPMFQFTSKISIGINPVSDPRGSKIGIHWYEMAKNTRPRFKAENFEAQIDYDLKSSSSYMILHFVNGWQHGFYFRQSKLIDIFHTYKVVNQVVAYERALQGEEDEYEDEEA